jgi:hypothetical protein
MSSNVSIFNTKHLLNINELIKDFVEEEEKQEAMSPTEAKQDFKALSRENFVHFSVQCCRMKGGGGGRDLKCVFHCPKYPSYVPSPFIIKWYTFMALLHDARQNFENVYID